MIEMHGTLEIGPNLTVVLIMLVGALICWALLRKVLT